MTEDEIKNVERQLSLIIGELSVTGITLGIQEKSA